MIQKSSKGSHNSRINDEAKSKLEVHYVRHVDQIDRWKREHESNQAIEEQIAAVSRFSYDLTDYGPLMERKPFETRPVPSFDYLATEAKHKVEQHYFYQLAAQGGGLIIGLIVMLISGDTIFLWGTVLFNIILAGSLYLSAQARQKAINQALANAEAEAQRKRSIILERIEQEQSDHERKEDERISVLERLFVGDKAAVVIRIDDVLPKLQFPSLVDVEIDILDNIPWIRILLPPKDVIPLQTSSLSNSGRVRYENKEPRYINKQYIECCAAIVIQIVSAIYGTIPSFDKGYFQGYAKTNLDDECFLDLVLDRVTAETVCRANSGLAAIRAAGGKLECNTILAMEPVKPTIPEGWTNEKSLLMRSLKVRIHR